MSNSLIGFLIIVFAWVGVNIYDQDPVVGWFFVLIALFVIAQDFNITKKKNK
ncbi:hypothetical protein N9A38_04195 [Gammaproteobacteria bacterium]|nr:hypothetical protein [Gammaproteobacteria bacterium]